MSDDHVLSQDEINALLKQATGEDEAEKNDPHHIDEVLTEMERDALGEIGNISLGNAATSLSILLGQEVDITTPRVHIVHQNEFEELFPVPHVGVHVDYTDGFVGMNLFVLKESDAMIIADLMMGGTGEPESNELTDLHLSAVQEAMNQMMGSAATSMSTMFNRMVNITPPGIGVLDVAEGKFPNFSEDIIIGISFRLKIGNLVDSNMIQLKPLSFAKELVDSLLGVAEDSPQSQEEAKVSAPDTNATDSEQLIEEEKTEQSKAIEDEKETKQQPVSFSYPSFSESSELAIHQENLDLLMDIQLQVSVELGRSKKKINEILGLRNGSIVELNRLAGEPVDILVNNKMIAKGEVVVMGENFAVRLTEIISPAERLRG